MAIRCNSLPALAWKIDRLLDDPARLAAMRANAQRLARPHAARDIAATLVGEGSNSGNVERSVGKAGRTA